MSDTDDIAAQVTQVITKHNLRLGDIYDTQHGTLALSLDVATDLWNIADKMPDETVDEHIAKLGRATTADQAEAIAAFHYGWAIHKPWLQRAAGSLLLLMRDQLELTAKANPPTKPEQPGD